MKDDAVAPVIAVMLILAVAATAFAIFNGIYIPSLKQAAEIEHLRNVESSFQHVSSDIERAVADKRDGTTVSEPVQLGGGDVFFNPLRSAGTLSVTSENNPVYYLVLDNGTTAPPFFAGTIVNISYDSAGNFWQELGYRWQYGYLNVTKYGKKQTPLSYSTMAEITNEFNTGGSLGMFAGSFGGVEYSMNQTLFPVYGTDGNTTAFLPRGGNCSRITMTAVNLVADPDHPYISSNGFGRLELRTRVISREYYGVTNITMASDMKPFGNATEKAWNESFSALAVSCNGNIRFRPDFSDEDISNYTISQDVSPVNVTLNTVNIVVGAY